MRPTELADSVRRVAARSSRDHSNSRPFLKADVASKPRDVLHYSDEAGRAAYLAGYHAAQALIYDSTGREAKTHKGVHSQFNRLVRSDPRFDDELRRFLVQTYDLKAIADYEYGPDSAVPMERVEAAIATAIRFVACVESSLV